MDVGAGGEAGFADFSDDLAFADVVPGEYCDFGEVGVECVVSVVVGDDD